MKSSIQTEKRSNDGSSATAQRIGEPPTGSVEIPRRKFQKMLNWYEAEQPNVLMSRRENND